MKMRVVSLILVLIMLFVTLTSCCTESADADKENPFYNMFEFYTVSNNTCVLVDKGTRVCYLWRGVGRQGGLTVMLDEDGRPLTYWEDGWDE